MAKAKRPIAECSGAHETEPMGKHATSKMDDSPRFAKAKSTLLSREEQQQILDSFVLSLVYSISLSDERSTSSIALSLLITNLDQDTTALMNALKTTSLSSTRKELLEANWKQCSRKYKLILAEQLIRHYRNALVIEMVHTEKKLKMTSTEDTRLVEMLKTFALYICLIWRFRMPCKTVIGDKCTAHTCCIGMKDELKKQETSSDQEIFSLIAIAISNHSNDWLIRAGLITQFILKIAAVTGSNNNRNHVALILHKALFALAETSQIFGSKKHKLFSPKSLYLLEERIDKLEHWAETILQDFGSQYLFAKQVVGDMIEREVRKHAMSMDDSYHQSISTRYLNNTASVKIEPSPPSLPILGKDNPAATIMHIRSKISTKIEDERFRIAPTMLLHKKPFLTGTRKARSAAVKRICLWSDRDELLQTEFNISSDAEGIPILKGGQVTEESVLEMRRVKSISPSAKCSIGAKSITSSLVKKNNHKNIPSEPNKNSTKHPRAACLQPVCQSEVEFMALSRSSLKVDLKNRNKAEFITKTYHWNTSMKEQGQNGKIEQLSKPKVKTVVLKQSAEEINDFETKPYDKEAYHTLLNNFTKDHVKHTPHPLVVVDEGTYLKFKDNTILLSNMQRFNMKTSNPSDGGQTTFCIEKHGKNIRHFFMKMNGPTLVDTCEIPFGFMFFMCRASEKCLVSDPSIVFIGDIHKTENYVILFLFVSDINLFSNMDGIPIWKNLEYLKLLKKVKKSTVKGNKGSHHYGSTGKCYSFGVRNAYITDAVTKVSLTNYAGDNATTMQPYKKFIWQHFHAVFVAFDRILTGLPCKLNFSVESMQHVSKDTVLNKYVINAGEIECDKIPSILTASINIDCRTRDLHCENDVTYTTIVVPKQEDTTSYIVFEFKLCDGAAFHIRCSQNSCFTYSAYCLTHRQWSTNGIKCMNLSSYSNKRVYCNFRRSYNRVKNFCKEK